MSDLSGRMQSHPLLSLLALIFIYQIARRLIIAFAGPLRNIPGPFWAKFSRLHRMQMVATGNSHQTDFELHQKYGLLVRNGPNRVSIADPEVVPVIYGMNNKYVKTEFYRSMVPVYRDTQLDSVFTARDPAKHQQLRKPVAQKFSMSSILVMEPIADECTALFITAMNELQGQAIDLGVWVQWYAFDVIGGMTFRKRFGFLEQRKDINNMIHDIEKLLPMAAVFGQAPETLPLISWALRPARRLLVPFNMSPPDPLRSILKFTEECMDEYDRDESIENNRPDFLAWLRSEEEKGKPISHVDLVNHLSNNLLAGSDTTGISLRSVFYFILKNPTAYCKLQEEIDEADRSGALSEFVTYSECLNLQYLQAVMKEAMRLAPGVSMPLERLVPSEGASICGHWLPGGTIVGINPAVVHRDADIFANPDDFHPERWIECTPAEARSMDRTLLTFGAGTRICLGKNISIMEMGKFVPQILRHFRLEWASPEPSWTIQTYWFAKQHGLLVRFKARNVEG